jgi:hypothetical protein
MLTQMFDPSFDQKCFEEEPLLGRIFEQSPCIGTVAATLMRQSVERGKEGSTVYW